MAYLPRFPKTPWSVFGRHIVEYEQKGRSRAAYGKEILNNLASRLTKEFGPGFPRSNIAYMRSFYAGYQHRARIVQTMSGQLPPFEKLPAPSAAGGTVQSAAFPEIVGTLSLQLQSILNRQIQERRNFRGSVPKI